MPSRLEDQLPCVRAVDGARMSDVDGVTLFFSQVLSEDAVYE
jgi:hypothetical protein